MVDQPAVGAICADGTAHYDGDRWGWQPLWLSRDRIAQLAVQRYGLEPARPEYLAAGLLNQSWRFGDHVLRVSRPERTIEQLRYEHAVLSALGRRVSAVVPPVAGDDGDTVQRVGEARVTCFRWIEGVIGTQLPPRRRLDGTAALLARCHRASLEHLHFEQRPGMASADQQDHWVWPRLAPLLRANVSGMDSCFRLFDEETEQLSRWFEARSADTTWIRAVVQGDTNPRNLIFAVGNRSESAVVRAAIDWDDCGMEVLHAAVAREAYDSGDPELFWKRYLDAGGPLPADSFWLLAGFARLRVFGELIWTDLDGSVNPYARDTIAEVADTLTTLRANIPLDHGSG